MDIPKYKIEVNEEGDTGVKAVSFVNYPAIEEDFIALSKAEPAALHFKAEGDKQILTGPALIPDLQILRVAEGGEPYYIEFSKETIEQIRNKFFSQGFSKNTNVEHSSTLLTDNVVVESWIIEDSEKDKAVAMGFKNLPAGTWMLSIYIPSVKFWNEEIKTGHVKGFSIEGSFIVGEQTLFKNQNTLKEMSKEVFNKIVAAIKPLFFADHCEGCNKKDEALGPALASAIMGAFDVWTAEQELDKTAAWEQVAAGAEMTVDRILEIVQGPENCPTTAEVTALAANIPGANLEDFVAAWTADGCTEEAVEEETEANKEEAVLSAHIMALKVQIDELKADKAEAKRIAAEALAICKTQKEQIETLTAIPAAKPIIEKPATPATPSINPIAAPAKMTLQERVLQGLNSKVVR